jgi:hypothetical protein
MGDTRQEVQEATNPWDSDDGSSDDGGDDDDDSDGENTVI